MKKHQKSPSKAKYTTGSHNFKTHAVLSSSHLAGIGVSPTTVPTKLFFPASSSNNPHTTESQNNPNSVTYLPPSKRLMRSDTLLDFSFVTLETAAGLSSSILGFWFIKALCLGVWYVAFCRWIGFGGTANNNSNKNQSLIFLSAARIQNHTMALVGSSKPPAMVRYTSCKTRLKSSQIRFLHKELIAAMKMRYSQL